MSSLIEIARKLDYDSILLYMDILVCFQQGSIIENMCSMDEQVRFGEFLEETGLIDSGKFWLQFEASLDLGSKTNMGLNAICEMDFTGEEARLVVSNFWHKDNPPKEIKKLCQDKKVFMLTTDSLAMEINK